MTTGGESDRFRTITVPGRGAVIVAADLARIRLGVVVVRSTASDARAEAGATMDRVLRSLAGAGVAASDIRAALVALDPVRDYSDGAAARITGYQLTNSVEATIRAVADVGAVIDAALGAGATSVDGLTFESAEPDPIRTAARRLAFADARRRAETLATEAGVALGDVVAVVEEPVAASGPPTPFTELRAKAAEVATPVAAGEVETVVNVAVAFAIGAAPAPSARSGVSAESPSP